MDSLETKYTFLDRVNAIHNLTAQEADDRQIMSIINTAQYRVFFSSYNPKGNKYGEGAEDGNKRRKDLSEFITAAWIPLYTDALTEVFSGGITYTCTVSDYTVGDDRKITITASSLDIDAVVDSSIIDSSALLSLGLTKGSTINGTVGNTDSFSIINIESNGNSTILEVDKSATGMTEFVGGIGLSKNQYERNNGKAINGFIVDMPDDILYTLQESVVTTLDPRVSVNTFPVTHDYVEINKNNPYKQPYKNLVWGLDKSSNIKGLGDEDGTIDVVTGVYQRAKSNPRVELITQKNSKPVLLYVVYYKLPRRFVVDEDTPSNNVPLEWDASVHDMIIDEAVKIYSASANPELYQVKQAERNSSE